MTDEYMSVDEAAKYMNKTRRCVTGLCSKGKLEGAKKLGVRVWMIPTKSVLEYKPSPQGFAVTHPREKARKEAEKARQLAEMNAAIRYYANQEQASE
ncbi:MAG: helix-turn-helix domain-containing protein [Synergistaceae bacterium]|nr:helix-turn-helix domain-containing protein [Synergistaceae bacterium]